MTTIPEPWASALVRAGFTDPRYTDDRPSLSRLAEAAGMHTTTLSKMVRGEAQSKVENVAKVAGFLGVDVLEVSRWVDQARTQSGPYAIPPEIDLLTHREQQAVTELIRAIAATRLKGGREHGQDSSPAIVGPEQIPHVKRRAYRHRSQPPKRAGEDDPPSLQPPTPGQSERGRLE